MQKFNPIKPPIQKANSNYVQMVIYMVLYIIRFIIIFMAIVPNVGKALGVFSLLIFLLCIIMYL